MSVIPEIAMWTGIGVVVIGFVAWNYLLMKCLIDLNRRLENLEK